MNISENKEVVLAAGDAADGCVTRSVIKILSMWYGFWLKRRWLLGLLLVIGAVACSVLSGHIRWQTNLLAYFSHGSGGLTDLKKATAAGGIAGQMHLDVHAKAGAQLPQQKLVDAVQHLAKSLRASGCFRMVWTGLDEQQQIAAASELYRMAPAILNARQRQVLRSRMNQQYLNRRFVNTAGELAAPDAQLQLARLEHDPFDVSGLLAGTMESLSLSHGGYMSHGVLLSGDGRHAMLTLEPEHSPNELKEATAVMGAIHAAIGRMRARYPAAGVWVVGPARHYEDNSRRVKRDVAVVSLLGSVAVALALVVYFRSAAAVIICVVPPIVGFGLALGVAGALGLHLPLMILAFGGLILGATTDYGIQLTAAARQIAQAQGWSAALPAQAVRRVIGPISMSVLTSVTGYGALMFTGASGLQQLGVFVAAATLSIWLVTFLILPVGLGAWVLKGQPLRFKLPPAVIRGVRWTATAAFAGLLVWLGHAALGLHWNYQPMQLDGSPARVSQQEADFYRVWGDIRGRALVLVQAHSAAHLLARQQHVYEYLQSLKADKLIAGVQSPAVILPDAATVKRRLAAWHAMWQAAGDVELRRWLKEAANKAGFEAQYWAAWSPPVAKAAALSAKQRVAASPVGLLPGAILQSGGEITMATVVQSNPKLTLRMRGDWIGELRLRFGHVLVLSGTDIVYSATDHARVAFDYIGPWVLLAVLVPMAFYFGRCRRALLEGLTLLCGLLGVLGVSALTGGLTILSIIPLLFTMGVAVDYGIYAGSDWSNHNPDSPAGQSRSSATFVCGLTTLLGTASLILAGHPALHAIGLQLTAGIACGYVASLLIVEPMIRFWARRRRSGGVFVMRVVRVGAEIAAVAVLLMLAAPVVGQLMIAHQRPARIGKMPHLPLVRESNHLWRVGHAWMLRRDGNWEMYVHGSPEQIGYAAAKLGAPIDLRIENEMLVRLNKLAPNMWARWLLLRGTVLALLQLHDYIPLPIKQEIYAEAVGHWDQHAYMMPTYPRLLMYHALDDISQNLIDNPLIQKNDIGCTGIAAMGSFSGDGHLWLARNFDFEGGEAFDRQKSITFVRPRHGIAFATVAWPGLAGCVTGMNADRIGLYVNAAATKDFRRIGTPMIIVAREVLQFAHSLSQAERIVSQAKVFVSNIIVVGDGKTGRAVVLEKSPRRFAVVPVAGSTAVANELTSAVFRDDPVNQERIGDGTTAQRQARAAAMLAAIRGHVNEFTLAHLLRDKHGAGGKNIGFGNRNSIDGLIATHSVIMDLTAGKMWVAAWPHADGAYAGINVLAMLRHAPTAAEASADTTPCVPASRWLQSGGWRTFKQTRKALVAGVAELDRKKFGAALGDASRAIELDPHFFEGYELRGMALYHMRRYGRAMHDLSRALALDPPYRPRRNEIRREIARCRAHRGGM